MFLLLCTRTNNFLFFISFIPDFVYEEDSVFLSFISIILSLQEKSIKTNKSESNTSESLTPDTETSMAQDSSFQKRLATISPSPRPPLPNLSVNTVAENASLDVVLRDSKNVTTSQSPQLWPPSLSANVQLTTNGTTRSLDVQQRDGGVVSGGGEEISEVFAKEFCQWFYTMVNRLQPEAAHLEGDSLTADAFVANSSVDIYLYSGQKVR